MRKDFMSRGDPAPSVPGTILYKLNVAAFKAGALMAAQRYGRDTVYWPFKHPRGAEDLRELAERKFHQYADLSKRGEDWWVILRLVGPYSGKALDHAISRRGGKNKGPKRRAKITLTMASSDGRVAFVIDGKRYAYVGDGIDVDHVVRLARRTPGQALAFVKAHFRLIEGPDGEPRGGKRKGAPSKKQRRTRAFGRASLRRSVYTHRGTAAHEGALRRWDALTPAEIGRLSREETLDLLQWNDPNGSYRDEDNDEPLTLLEAHRLLLAATRANRPSGGKAKGPRRLGQLSAAVRRLIKS